MRSEAPNIRLTASPLSIDDGRPWKRLAYGATAILAIVGVFTCWCDTPMIWDGAYQFCFSLIQQKPYFYLTRFHSYILWTPMIWLGQVSSNLTALKMAYGLPFTLAPAFSVAASWWIVRRRAPHLILWAIFGAAAGPLPGQIFIINDSIFQQHMFWPVFLGMLVTLEWPQMVALSLLVVFQFSHQIGLVLLTGGAGAAALLALCDSKQRGQLVAKSAIAAALAAVAFWKIIHFPDSYAQREFTWEAAHGAWQWGVEGYPLRGLELMWAAGGCVLLAQVLRGAKWDELRRPLGVGAIFLVIAAAVTWAIWACDSHKWSTAANYRRWVVPLSIPFYLLAFLDQWLRTRSPHSAWQSRTSARTVGYLVAGTFAIVISIQSICWLKMTRRLSHDVEASAQPIVPWSAIAWTADTAMYHWGTTSYVFVLEGQTPRHLVLDPDREDADKQMRMLLADQPKVPLSWFTPVSPYAGPGGWFDFWPMLKQIRK